MSDGRGRTTAPHRHLHEGFTPERPSRAAPPCADGTMGGGMSEQTSPRTTLTINWIGIAGGALAAVTSAVALAGLKSLGAYGPLVGAAVGSVLASTAAAIYLVADAQPRADRRGGAAGARAPGAQPPRWSRGDPARRRPASDAGRAAQRARPRAAGRARGPGGSGPGRRRGRAQRPAAPRHVLLLGLAAFVLAVGGIAVYEVTTGSSVAAERQGTVGRGGAATRSSARR